MQRKECLPRSGIELTRERETDRQTNRQTANVISRWLAGQPYFSLFCHASTDKPFFSNLREGDRLGGGERRDNFFVFIQTNSKMVVMKFLPRYSRSPGQHNDCLTSVRIIIIAPALMFRFFFLNAALFNEHGSLCFSLDIDEIMTAAA